MELRQVRYFIALSEALNFTKAAQMCNVTQPTLTLAIQKLEEEFGGPLIHRERNNTHLTQLGELVLPLLEQAERASQAAQAIATEMTSERRVIMSIGVSDSIEPQLVTSSVGEVIRTSPNLELRVHGGTDEIVAAGLLDGSIQLGLIDLSQPFDERLRAYPIGMENIQIAIADTDPLAKKESLTAKDLIECDWIFQETSAAHELILAAIRRHKPAWTPRHHTTRLHEALSLCAGGFGVTLVGTKVVLPHGVVRRPLLDPIIARTLGLIEARGRPLPSPALAFRRYFQAHGAV